MIATKLCPSDNDSRSIPPEQLEQLLQFQRDALKMVADGEETNTILDRLCLLAEAMVPNSVATIMQLNQSCNRLSVRAAPSVPEEGVEALNGLKPSPAAGSCGTAVFKKEPVFVSNTLTDHRWAPHIKLAEQFNLRACWSNPVRDSNDQVIGSFALSSFETRAPGAFHKRLLDTGSYLTGIVLEREHHTENLLTAAVAFDHMSEAVMVTDANGQIIQVNSAFEMITGYTAEEAISQSSKLLHSDRQDESFYKALNQTLESNGEWRGEIWSRRKNGEVFPELLSVRAVHDTNGNIHRHISVFADITEIKDSEQKLWQMAHHDTLSKLPNRLLLSSRLENAILRAKQTGGLIALLFIDLDRFKNINDSLGHQTGDELLKQVAVRLQSCVHKDDTVARLGGDEFIVLLERLPNINAAFNIAERLINLLAEPFEISNKSLFVTASIGISLYPEDADEPNTLLQHADAAMYLAKSLGRNQLAFYSPELTRSVQHRLDLENDLRNALVNEEFVLHYQPQFSSADGELVGLETLVRWQHPEKGLIPPNDFIPVAEETGLIRQLGSWITETACRQAQEWRLAGHTQFTLAVNVSPYQLDDSCTQCLEGIFQLTGFPPENFELEVTESLFIEKGGVAVQQLTGIREELGVNLAMDDFGTGHSSLSQLKLLPIRKLKVDRSFVSDLPDDSDDAAITRAIILMAHTLGLSVVAEGVETEAQKQFLCQCGCDDMQGFLFSKPMPADEVSKLLKNNNFMNQQLCQ